MAGQAYQQVGHYRLVRLLGSGGFADVYQGEHRYLNRPVAVKVLHRDLMQQELPGFLKEAQMMARLTHPHIMPVLDFGIDGMPYLVMEYLPLGSLRACHPPGTCVPLPTIVSYVTQIADALDYAHEANVLHRDVKPTNVLVRTNGQLVLSDFGIATAAYRSLTLQTLHAPAHHSDSPSYMAPEQIRGQPHPASSQYALGMMVYEWLCGRPAFDGEEPGAILFQQTYSPVPPLRERVPTLAPTVEQVVLKALAKDPQQRFACLQAFAQALREGVQAAAEEPRAACRQAQLPAPPLPASVQLVHISHAPPISPKTKKHWYQEGSAHCEAGRYAEAIESYTQALQLDPKYATAYFGRGLMHSHLQQYEQAIADYEQALQLNPKYIHAYYNRGKAHYKLEQYEQAIADYEQVLQLDPKHAHAQAWRKQAYRLLQGKQENASPVGR